MKEKDMNDINYTIALRQYEEYRAERENMGVGACSFDTWLEEYGSIYLCKE